MSKNSPINEVPDGLEELIDEHLRRITNRLRQVHSVEDVSKEVAALNDLLNSYKQRSELFDSLADVKTPEAKRQQIREMLKAQRVRVAANRQACKRTVERSHQILRRSARLLSRVQRHVDRETHRGSIYRLEVCRYCDGIGGTPDNQCPGCTGKGSVLVHQPAIKCPRCLGSGKPETKLEYLNVCAVCRGCGWVMTISDRDREEAEKQ
jgi:DnaJ-class molecular chaperone